MGNPSDGGDLPPTVAERKLEGCTNAAIAAELGVVETMVERKLQRIRRAWSREGEP